MTLIIGTIASYDEPSPSMFQKNILEHRYFPGVPTSSYRRSINHITLGEKII